MPAQAPTRDGPRINDEIRVPQVRLIDEKGGLDAALSYLYHEIENVRNQEGANPC